MRLVRMSDNDGRLMTLEGKSLGFVLFLIFWKIKNNKQLPFIASIYGASIRKTKFQDKYEIQIQS